MKTNHCSLLIQLINENQLKCSLINNGNTVDERDFSLLSISFEMNEIIVSETRKNSIHFMNDLIQFPHDFKEYQITYQQTDYFVIAEVLLSLFLFHYKSEIEKQFIIDETIFQIESQKENQQLMNRIKVSLDAIGLTIKEFEIPEYDYQKQGQILHEILDKFKEFNKYKNLLQKAKQSQLFDNTFPLNEESFNEIIMKQVPFKERNKLSQLDNYCLFITSKFFESIDDHIGISFLDVPI